jgi:cell division protein FtsI (penicillin-binding protein 3)
MTEAPDPNSPPRSGPFTSAGRAAARQQGAPHAGAVPRMEHVRVTAPDLRRRAALERSRPRLVFAAGFFLLLFAAVVAKLAAATVLDPLAPPPRVDAEPRRPLLADAPPLHQVRASITDRNGEILAISLPTAALYANPREMIDTGQVAHTLKQLLPRLDEAELRARLAEPKQFVYLARQITPGEEQAINLLGIPGIYFQPTDQRRYPQGRVAAQLLGAVDVDGHGVAGVEKSFDKRMAADPTPLRLALDVRVQAVVRDELAAGMDMFTAIGACGIVMDVRTGEILAMVSLPDYDANQFSHAADEQRFNRAVTGMYEPGSTFKLQTAAMALDSGVVHIWDEFNAADPIHIGRFTITDFEGKHRWLYLPEVLAYSSNLGAAHIAQVVGAERQRDWLRSMGMLARVGVQLPEAGMPLAPPLANWKEAATMTIGFGHGIAVSPLHVVRGTAVLANGGAFFTPTVLASDSGVAAAGGDPVMQPATSDIIRKLMRLVVTNGYGKPADVPGYFVGGKTGTAEKVGKHGAYEKHANVSAFICVFPMNAPRYAVYMMLDEPHGTAATGGFSTAGAVSAPMAGRVIGRIAPMLGLFPETDNAEAIQASLSIPLQPARPPGERALTPPGGTPLAAGPRAPAVPAQAMPGRAVPAPAVPALSHHLPLLPAVPELRAPTPPGLRHTDLPPATAVAAR